MQGMWSALWRTGRDRARDLATTIAGGRKRKRKRETSPDASSCCDICHEVRAARHPHSLCRHHSSSFPPPLQDGRTTQ